MSSAVVLAFDYGLKHVGVAMLGALGEPETLSELEANYGRVSWPEVSILIKRWSPHLLLVGLPLSTTGAARGPMCRRARQFARWLSSRSGLDCELVDERLTSAAARSIVAAAPSEAAGVSLHSIAAAEIIKIWQALNSGQDLLDQRYQAIQQRLTAACNAAGRAPEAVTMIAAVKSQSPDAVRNFYRLGGRHIGENYFQESVSKQAALKDLPLCWHFFGQIQSNKALNIARCFNWVHTMSREKIARAISDHRQRVSLPPMQCCIQVDVCSAGDRGVPVPALAQYARFVSDLPGLTLRGLMCLPPASISGDARRAVFRRLADLLAKLRQQPELGALDMLSMGMSDDFEDAVACGATMVRIGRGLFGARA